MQPLLDNQTTAISKLSRFKVGALFMDQGTGKSRTALELVRSVPDIDYVLHLAPFRSVNPKVEGTGIQSEIAKWGGYGVETDFVGIESISASGRIYLELYCKLQTKKNPFIIVDESIKIKNWGAKRTNRIIELGKLCQFKLILNGIPISRNLLDIWAQMEFLSPKILNMGQAEFRNTFCEWTKVTKIVGNKRYTREFITKYHNVDYLYSLIGHYVYECDLELSVHEHHFDYSYTIEDELKQEYYRLKETYLEDEKLMAMNNNIFLELTQKMQHLYCCSSEKFSLAKELFKSWNQEETIIFCFYQRSQEECKKAFPKAIVLSLQSDSTSLNLQHCCNTIFWDKTWDFALIDGAIHRTLRKGQNRDCRFAHFNGDVNLETLLSGNNQKKKDLLKYFKQTALRELLNEL